MINKGTSCCSCANTINQRTRTKPIINPKHGDIASYWQIGKKKTKYEHTYTYIVCDKCGNSEWLTFTKWRVRTHLCTKCFKNLSKEKITKEKSKRWKGGRYKGKDGYIYLSIYKDDPIYHLIPKTSIRNKTGVKNIAEHRYVMTKHLIGDCIVVYRDRKNKRVQKYVGEWDVIHINKKSITL
ncbi:MAG TPA: hypothetical protein VI911_10400 [Patescibacteria group bacterium]|nr:hypothetical protein [Patescibacteria group bacterium]